MSNPPPNEAVKDLASILGDEATREIVQLFLDDFPASIRRIETSGAADQRRIAHGLKSSALHLGAENLSRRMKEIEERLERKGPSPAPDELEGAMAEFESVAPGLRKYAAT